ncbi:hypothetical protein [Prochlorococcus sp. MIT 1223]|uniref:hypothetical protein n=1 Tax=Prochlorococcus sp. MIT 1223 TaxID=3096217 RepID=UPI002A757A8C|nr:hypothetical protein [Prochlorococcus sp. MIT 1223]
MNKIVLMSPFLILSTLAAQEAIAHIYDSIGVEAGVHSHQPEKADKAIKDNCFIDPKLGPICK